GVLEPLAELGGVVGWLAVVRGGDNDDAALLGQRANMVVERLDRRDEPAVGRILGDRMGEALGSTQVRAIEYEKPRVVSGNAKNWCSDGLCGWLGRDGQSCGCQGSRGGAPSPALDLDVEVVRLDGQRLLGVKLVVGVVHELEPLQEHAQH